MSDLTRMHWKQINPLIAITHSGKFHADDVLAACILRLATSCYYGDWDKVKLSYDGYSSSMLLIRTRDAKAISDAHIVFDVGGEYDPDRLRYDHHQRERALREDGTPYSSAGLIWRDFGMEALDRILPEFTDIDIKQKIWKHLDKTLVLGVDRIDNGLETADRLSIVQAIDDFNPSWDSVKDDKQSKQTLENLRFFAAVEFMENNLRNSVDRIRSRYAAISIVLKAAEKSSDPRVLVMEQNMPWQSAVFETTLPVLYAVYPDSNGNWMLSAMPPSPGSYEQRLPLPESWAGLKDEELALESGVEDAIFTHQQRFIAGAKSREGAIALANKSMELGLPVGKPESTYKP